METNNSWNFQAIDLPKFTTDNGYFNPMIETTFPAINSSIDPNILKISINFSRPVEFSSNSNLSIYQVIGDHKYLRQLVTNIDCSIEYTENFHATIVSADVLKSTFSVFKGNYFIKMDNNFVRDGFFKE